ncbi:MAG: hypothetical protein HQL87_00815 [Magnetococcales bacterium]|nr:hypothetical protein [Magnetococcales bacterium]
MNISVIEQNGCRHVMVQKESLTEAEESRLLALLATPSSLPIELRFYELKWISATLVEAIALALAQEERSMVYFYSYHLFTYLRSLGLPVRLVHGQRLESAAAPPCRALVLGGSADSLDKIRYLIERLPLGPVTVFVIQHVAEDKINRLDELLRQQTPYQVLMPHDMMAVETGTIYVAPPGYNMRVAHGQVYLTRDRKKNAARPSIDLLFEAVSREYGATALGVLLCGWGHDGVAGAQHVVAQGGKLLILNPDDCPTAKALVKQAQREVVGALVVPLEVATCLAATAATGDKPPEEHALELFFAAVRRVYGYDYRNHHADMLGRRLEITRQALGLASPYACQREILTNPEAGERLFLELSIHVTAFFRMPEQFKLLRQAILPFLDSFCRIKIWVAGCASGEEAYSLAILLQELGLYERSMIYATDINPFILMQARNGLYGREEMATSRAHYVQAGGTGRFDDYCVERNAPFFAIHPDLRRNILFYRHSLVEDGPFNEFQLIVCRNLLIYFNQTLQNSVMELFERSLHQDGVLLLGEKENIRHGQGERFFTPLTKGQTAYARHSRIMANHGQ